jgi:hypothetical protein
MNYLVANILKSKESSPISCEEVEMRFFGPHAVLLHFVNPMLALGSYLLIIRSICMFLAFGEESDKIRAQSADGSHPVR